jgi:hypothetical protein
MRSSHDRSSQRCWAVSQRVLADSGVTPRAPRRSRHRARRRGLGRLAVAGQRRAAKPRPSPLGAPKVNTRSTVIGVAPKSSRGGSVRPATARRIHDSVSLSPRVLPLTPEPVTRPWASRVALTVRAPWRPGRRARLRSTQARAAGSAAARAAARVLCASTPDVAPGWCGCHPEPSSVARATSGRAPRALTPRGLRSPATPRVGNRAPRSSRSYRGALTT